MKNHFTTDLTYFLAGIVAGGATALLMAPASGEQTRGQIRESIDTAAAAVGKKKEAVMGQIEGVRVAASRRGAGVGEAMIEWALERCRERGCRLAQLTTDKTRTSAFEFYRRLGFEATHEGMKRPLDAAPGTGRTTDDR